MATERQWVYESIDGHDEKFSGLLRRGKEGTGGKKLYHKTKKEKKRTSTTKKTLMLQGKNERLKVANRGRIVEKGIMNSRRDSKLDECLKRRGKEG